jgi:hypothetical protein
MTIYKEGSMFLADKRRSDFTKIIDRWSETKLFRIFLTVWFSLGFIILLPFMIVVSPFVMAWDLAGAITQSVNRKQYEKFSAKDWDKIKFSMDSWKKMEND